MKTPNLLLTLVRHGETEANKAGILQGHCDYPLTPLGVDQAKLCGAVLAGVCFAKAFSSDLKRAYVTACLISDSTGGSLPSSQIEQEALVKEKAFGILERLPRGTDPVEALHIVAERDGLSVEEVEKKYPPTETQEEMKVRQLEFIHKLVDLKLDHGSKVLVVSHGAFIKAFIANMCDMKIDEVDRIANCSVSGIRVDIDDSAKLNFTLVAMNCCAHQVIGTEGTDEMEFEGGNVDELAWLRY